MSAQRHQRGRRPGYAARVVATMVAFAALATLAACAARNAVWLEPGSRRERVVFRLSDSPGSTGPPSYFYGLTVMTCGGNAVLWTVRNAETASATRPVRIVYGEPPRGYYSADGPRPLRPGCYRVVVSGPASTEFRIEADGTVSSATPPGADTARP